MAPRTGHGGGALPLDCCGPKPCGGGLKCVDFDGYNTSLAFAITSAAFFAAAAVFACQFCGGSDRGAVHAGSSSSLRYGSAKWALDLDQTSVLLLSEPQC
eukprot:224262-Amphidinium_carterae.1